MGKRCHKCGLVQPTKNFYRNAAQKDGLSGQCQPCHRQTVKESRKRNPSRYQRNRSDYIARHPELREEKSRKTRELRAGRARVLFSRALLEYHASPRSAGVYFVGPVPLGEHPVKIGTTDNITVRMRSLLCGSPIPLVVHAWVPFSDKVDAFQSEAHLHASLALDRLHGEWFRPSPEVMDAVRAASLVSADGLLASV